MAPTIFISSIFLDYIRSFKIEIIEIEAFAFLSLTYYFAFYKSKIVIFIDFPTSEHCVEHSIEGKL